MRVSPESLVATFVCSGRRLNSRTVAEFRRGYGCRRSAPLLARQHVAPTNQGICEGRAHISISCPFGNRAEQNCSRQYNCIRWLP
jgi:hypothetical protein